MRILLILPWGERLGGAETMLQAVLDGAPADGHELEPVFLQSGPWPEELRAAGFRVEVIPAGRLRRTDRWLASVLRLAGLLRRRRPDLILSWSAKTQLYGAPAALLAGMAGRVLWWQHGIQEGHWTDRLATALPARAIGCSSHAAARAQAQLAPARQTFVVHPGTRDPAAECARGGRAGSGTVPEARAAVGSAAVINGANGVAAAPGGPPVIGIVGRLQPWKGQDRMLAAQALLRERGLDMRLLIVGGDAYGLSSDYAASLPGLARRLGLEGAVTMTGQVADVGPYVEQMDVLVNVSDPEPFGIVLLEGMARGVPVLAVDSGGPAEIVEHGRTGALAASGEPADLADALEPLLRSRKLRDELGAAGHERFRACFTDHAMREGLFERLGELHEERSRSRGRGGHGGQNVSRGWNGAGDRSRSGSERASRGRGARARQPAVTIVANDVGAVGGMECQLAELVGGLSRRGHEVTVIARTCELPERERERGEAIRFHRVWGPRRPFLLAYPWFLLAGSLVLMRRRRGIVQATGAVVLNRVDVIAVHCCHQVYRAVPGSRTLPARGYAVLLSAVKRAAERLCLRINRTAVLVCVSEGVADEVRAHYPAAAGRVLPIHNGVDLDRFAPGAHAARAGALRGRLGIDARRLVVAFVGGNWEHKGLRHLLAALARAGEWDLVVAGAGNLPRFRALAQEIGVGERVHWLGVVPDVEVVYALADAFALPSGYETFSLVTFEAAASGLPILATPVSGVRELISDGASGYLLPADPDAIAQRLCELGADPQLRARLGAAARAAAGAFGWAKMVREHHELYADLAI